MKLKELSKESLPREKMIQNGAESLSNEELLAILLNSGTKEESALEIAYKILASIDNISSLLNINYERLIKFPGIKEKKACTILASLELSKRAISYNETKMLMSDPKSVYLMLKPLVIHKNNEILYVLYLDVKLKIIKRMKMQEGGANFVSMNRKQIAFEAMNCGASFLILSHNHPSGDPTPSHADIDNTLSLKLSLLDFDIELIDHIIIGANNYYSFKEHNLID